MIIPVYHPADRIDQVQVLRRCAAEFRAAGYDLTFSHDPPSPDGPPAIVHGHYATAQAIAALPYRVIILERSDSCEFYDHDVVRLPNVVAVVKHGALVPDLMRTAPRRYTTEVLYAGRDMPAREPLTAEQAAKVVVWLNFGQYDRMKPWAARAAKFRPSDVRSTDVMFMGGVDRNEPGVTAHRKACVAALRKLPPTMHVVCREGRPMRQQDYMAMACDSKIMVSPWGYGEYCFRDWEAMAAGAVLVKPAQPHVVGAPTLADGVNCVFCRPDFADLEAVCADILARPRVYDSIRWTAAEEVVYFWRSSTVVERFAGVLDRLFDV
jgi:hypothetical protein